MKRRYKAILFAVDGDWVTDYRGSESIDEVQELLANQGSRWFFFPFCAVIRDHQTGHTAMSQRLVDVAEPFDDWKGVSIKTFRKMIEDMPVPLLASLLHG